MNLAVADWISRLFRRGRGAGKYISTMPYFLHQEGSHVPLSEDGVVILTVLSTSGHDINQAIIRVAEQEFYDQWSHSNGVRVAA
jgi:hypothetical protein